ncbi:hypothetical protein CDIK_2562 [Cucumispora dikerogammari]|nr:hypothetical protein CDIK_2562 [Cucumispora dikerogammari]
MGFFHFLVLLFRKNIVISIMLGLFQNTVKYEMIFNIGDVYILKLTFIYPLIKGRENEFFSHLCDYLEKKCDVSTPEFRFVIQLFPFDLIYTATKRKKNKAFTWQLD